MVQLKINKNIDKQEAMESSAFINKMRMELIFDMDNVYI